MKLNFLISTIPHQFQRYPTLGDWTTQSDQLTLVRASETGNPDYDFAIQLHEMVEAYLCRRDGISATKVDHFDLANVGVTSEPGELAGCPYATQHSAATTVERAFIEALGLPWVQYLNYCDDFFDRQPAPAGIRPNR